MTTPVRTTDLLIAPPGIPDARFSNTVMMLTHVNGQGSFALCVNRKTGYTLSDVIDNIDSVDLPESMPNVPVYWGGPMGTSSIWMIHSTDWSCAQTVALTDGWAMTSNVEMFHCIADGDHPRHFRIVIGYASWGPGQLSAELEGVGPWSKDNSWLVAHNLGPEWLFEQAVEDLWANVVTLSSHQAVDTWL
jgi:putative transcriptional regulator